jgi:hypothetical protein
MSWVADGRLCLTFIMIPVWLRAGRLGAEEPGPRPGPSVRVYDYSGLYPEVSHTPLQETNHVPGFEILARTAQVDHAAYQGSLETDLEAPSITVRLYNLANATTRDLEQAKHAAEQIFAQARISVRWLNCALSLQEARTSRACEEPSGRDDVDLVISTASITRPGIATDGSLGFALPLRRGRHAVVLWDRSLRMAESSGVLAGIILGNAMAHELGHLLMQSMQHSRTGIMRPRWGNKELHQAERGGLVFTPAQATAMRNRIRR